MAKQKSEFVSSFDVAARVFKSLANAVMDAGGSDDDLRRLESDTKLRGEVGRLIASTPSLLAPVGTVEIPATTQPFVAKDHFVVNTEEDAPLKISYLGENFRAWFLGKTEEARSAGALRYARLVRPSLDGPIIAGLGGEAKAETTLAEFYVLLARQPDGASGPLLTDGCANIFYVRDVSGVLCAVGAYWSGYGWSVDAVSVSYPDEWDAGLRVFSRNS